MIFLVSVTVVLLLIWQGSTYIQHRGKVGLNIALLPSDSTLSIDGTKTNPGKVYLLKGEHKLVASKKDFGDDVKLINTTDIPKGQIIYMLPLANTVSAINWLKQHPDVQRDREAAGSAEAERIHQLLIKKYLVINALPKQTINFKVDYSVDSNNNLGFTVTTYAIINGPSDYSQYLKDTNTYRQQALDYLKSNGIDPTKYKVSYIPSI
jgi:hypothetical protein